MGRPGARITTTPGSQSDLPPWGGDTSLGRPGARITEPCDRFRCRRTGAHDLSATSAELNSSPRTDRSDPWGGRPPKEAPRQRAPAGGRLSERLRRSARLETVRAHHIGSLGCKPLAGSPSGRRAAPLFMTTATAQRRPRCTAWFSSTPRPSSPKPKTLPAPTCRSSSKTSSTPASNAASWPTASCACAAATVGTTSWSRSAASGAGSAPHAARGGWRKRRRTW